MPDIVRATSPVWLKKKVRASLHQRGFCQPHERPPVDLRNILTEPKDASARCKDTPFLLNIPLAKCRAIRSLAFPCADDTTNPFIIALNQYQKTGDQQQAETILRRYYEAVQPATAGELLGVSGTTPGGAFALSPLCYDYPWDGEPRETLLRHRKMYIVAEAVGHGAKESFQGWHHFGPLHRDRIKLEAERLVNVYHGISEQGYLRDDSKDGDIAGVALFSQGDYVVLITKGHHRIAALTSLGYDSVPVRFGLDRVSFVHREHAARWLGVHRSGYTAEQAIEVFDRIFNGYQPAVCEDWNLELSRLRRLLR